MFDHSFKVWLSILCWLWWCRVVGRIVIARLLLLLSSIIRRERCLTIWWLWWIISCWLSLVMMVVVVVMMRTRVILISRIGRIRKLRLSKWWFRWTRIVRWHVLVVGEFRLPVRCRLRWTWIVWRHTLVVVEFRLSVRWRFWWIGWNGWFGYNNDTLFQLIYTYKTWFALDWFGLVWFRLVWFGSSIELSATLLPSQQIDINWLLLLSINNLLYKLSTSIPCCLPFYQI